MKTDALSLSPHCSAHAGVKPQSPVKKFVTFSETIEKYTLPFEEWGYGQNARKELQNYRRKLANIQGKLDRNIIILSQYKKQLSVARSLGMTSDATVLKAISELSKKNKLLENKISWHNRIITHLTMLVSKDLYRAK